MSKTQDHWEAVYRSKDETAVSWFQAMPTHCLALIQAAAPDRATPIIDVGGGASRLVDELFAAGYTDLTVLDISAAALAHTRARLGANAGAVQFVEADITNWSPARRWRVWNDRAVFHFLIDRESQDDYIRALTQATAPGAKVIIAGFAPDGPERCSGVPVERYSAERLAARLGADFRLETQEPEIHVTPSGARQSFLYCVFART